ncbi:MAG: Mur ligase family protein [Candidatus Saccharimonadales bacterium]
MEITSFKDIDKYIQKNALKLSAKESYSLDRVKNLLAELNNPQDKVKIVHVAGTSGKTSTCYYLAKLLSLNGYKTGLSISPHIETINERIQIDLKMLSKKEFCAHFEEFTKILKSLGIQVTYFELFVAFAFWYYAKAKVDYAVVEVGLGGLMDATNVVSREDKVCVITDIGLDHTDILGKTTLEIAKQKAGIIQKSNRVFCNKQDKAILDQFRHSANAKDARLLINPEESFNTFSTRNFSLAGFVANKIFESDSKPPLTEGQLKAASRMTIPGRMEKYSIGDKTVILDGAHNSQKIEGFLKSLPNEVKPDEYCFVLAVGKNKKDQLLKMAQAISKYAGHIILTSFETEQDFKHKSLPPGYLKSYFDDVPAEKTLNLDEAIEKAFARSEKTIIFTGSLYMIGPVRAKLEKIKA